MNLRERIEQGLVCGRGSSASADGRFTRPSSKPRYAPDQTFDTMHILLELDCDFRRKVVRGKCTTTFRPINDGNGRITFDAVGMKIRSVESEDGRKLRHSYDGKNLTVRFPGTLRQDERLTVSIRYVLEKSIAGVYFVGPDRSYPKKPVQLWTHGEAEESRYWFPCFDAPHDKATTEMIATVPRNFFALSNGALIDVREDRTRKTKSYHWRQTIPHSPYLVSLVAGVFSEIKDEWDGIPILYYCQPGREADMKRTFSKTPKMVSFYSKSIGVRYPFEKYAQIAVTDFIMGGMEHTTATTQTDRVLASERVWPEYTADWLVSHELAHQWFGDLLTCKEWSHAWLNESFATYFEALFTEHDLGKEEFDFEMYDKLSLYLGEDRKVYRRPIVTNVYRQPEDLFDRHLYEKGALVLHTLRHLLGDKLFWKAIHHYVETFQGKAVETSDLVNAIQESTGRNFRKFFEQWVYGPGHPEYTVHYWWDDARKTANVRVTQKPIANGKLFSVPVILQFATSGGKRRFTETIHEKEHTFKYRLSREPLDFRFDPDHGILKTTEVSKSYRMWVRQLLTDPHAVGRVEASKEVAKIATEESLKVLTRAFLKEKFWGTAREIAVAIGSTRLDRAKAFLINAVNRTRNPKVRRGVVEGLSLFQDDAAVSKLIQTFKKDKSYFVAADCLDSLVKTRSTRATDALKAAMKRESWNDIIRAQAVQSLSRVPTRESIRSIRKFSRYGMQPSTRAQAVLSLSRLSRNFPELFSDLFALAEDPQTRIRHAAISALGSLKDPRAVGLLEKISKDKRLPNRTRNLAEDSLLKIKPSRNES